MADLPGRRAFYSRPSFFCHQPRRVGLPASGSWELEAAAPDTTTRSRVGSEEVAARRGLGSDGADFSAAGSRAASRAGAGSGVFASALWVRGGRASAITGTAVLSLAGRA